MIWTQPELQRSNPTADVSYQFQGPGIGAGAEALAHTESRTDLRITEKSKVVEVGCGMGDLLIACSQRGAYALGIDIADACRAHIHKRLEEVDSGPGLIELEIMDASHTPIPKPDDTFDFAACTESLEHCSNGLYVVAEIKRTLKHGGLFTLAFPQPDRSLGYGGGEHAQIYPGFLKRASFELFMRQLYFKNLAYWENGNSDWNIWANYKGPGVVDVFSMGSANYDEKELFAPLDGWNGRA